MKFTVFFYEQYELLQYFVDSITSQITYRYIPKYQMIMLDTYGDEFSGRIDFLRTFSQFVRFSKRRLTTGNILH